MAAASPHLEKQGFSSRSFVNGEYSVQQEGTSLIKHLIMLLKKEHPKNYVNLFLKPKDRMHEEMI